VLGWLPRITGRRLLLPLAAFACTCAFVMQSMGWAQTSYLALSKALSHGTPQIDRWHWETRDKSYYRGHFYSVKAPGLSFATFPLYEVLHLAGAERLAHDARVTGEARGTHPWSYRGLQVAQYGYNRQRAIATRTQIEDGAPMAWALALAGVLAPALMLLVLVARLADRVAPGTGPPAAITLGAATLLLPFSTLLFSHVLSTALGFGAFALAWREREQAPRTALLAGAGALAGLAITSEYPLAIAAVIVGLYAIGRRGASWPRRAAAYAGGVLAGVAPLAAYNVWAFGSPLHMSYADAVAEQGRSGHATLGLNGGGVFGVTAPRFHDALSLLLGGRGLLTLTPVLAVAAAGVVSLHRSGRRREALTIGGVGLAYLLYDAGYWLPFGGGSPGPRFLIPALAFLAVGLGPAWRRWPAVTLALATVSMTTMVAATMSHPMIGDDNFGEWVWRIADLHLFQHTLLDVTGIAHGWPAILPFAVGAFAAFALGVRALGAAQLARGARWAPAALAGWGLAAAVLPKPLGWAPCTERIQVCTTTSAATGNGRELALILVAAGAGLLAVALVALAARVRRGSAQEHDAHAGAALVLEPQATQ